MTEHQTIYDWIFNAKSIGMWLMIMGHGGLVSFQSLIYSFHMPLFFILSGFLYKPRSTKETLKRDLSSLLIPYLMVNVLCLLYKCLVSPSNAIELLPYRIFSIILGNNAIFGLPSVCPPSWFLLALMIIRLVLSTGYNVKNQKRFMLCICCLTIFLILVIKILEFRLPFCMDCALLALPFVCFGYLFKELIAIQKKTTLIIGVVLFAAITYIANYYNGRVDMSTFNTGHNMLLYYSSSIFGSLAVIYTSQLFPTCRINKIISDGTILILGFNLIAISWADKICGHLTFATDNDFCGVLISLCILLCFCPLIVLSKKFFPVMLGNR